MSSYIICARRSAVVPKNGAFKKLLPHEIAAPVIEDLLKAAKIDKNDVQELIVSNALGAGGNPARLIALASGLPISVAGISIDRQCVGGLDAIMLADALISAGKYDVIIAGGVESYSRRPIRLHNFKDGREPQAYDQPPFTPWPNKDPDMIVAANQLALNLGISQTDQDRWAIESHQKSIAAQHNVKSVITPVLGISDDPYTRALSMRHCAKARRLCGTISAANMAVSADGAAFVLMVSSRMLEKIKTTSQSTRALEVVAAHTCGHTPELPGIAPIKAFEHAKAQAAIHVHDFKQIEIMEAFSAQAIACQKGTAIDISIVNPYGGALAKGHPIGASGTILAVNLFHGLQSGSKQYGGAMIAAAGGIGGALIVRSRPINTSVQ